MKNGWIAIPVLILALSGCGAMTGVSDGVITEYIDETGTVVKRVTDKVADASTQKEETVHKTLRNRDDKIAAAADKAGFKMSWQPVQKIVFYPGMAQSLTVTEYLPVVSYTEMPDFNQPLPTKPSEHPVWGVIDHLGGKAIDGTLWGYGIGKTAGVLKEAINAAGEKNNVTVAGDQNAPINISKTDQKVEGNESSITNTPAEEEEEAVEEEVVEGTTTEEVTQ